MLRKLGMILLALLSLGGCASASVLEHGVERRYTIKDDKGGVVDRFITDLKYLERRGVALKIDGFCASSCTLVMTRPKLDVCVTEHAEMRIHEPYMMNDDGDVVNNINAIADAISLWDVAFWDDYPEWVKQYIRDHGGSVPSVYVTGSSKDTLNIPYSVLKEHYPTCK